MMFASELRKADLARCALWHADGVHFRTLEGWFGAVAGEVGEMLEAYCEEQGHRWIAEGVLRVVGKDDARRHARKAQSSARRAMLDELADVAIYLDLLAACAGHEVGEPGVRYAHELGPDVAFPRAAYFVLKIGDTLHKLERARRDTPCDQPAEEVLLDTLGSQIDHAFVALESAAMSVDAAFGTAVAFKFNATSRKKGLPVRLELVGGYWRAVIGADATPEGEVKP